MRKLPPRHLDKFAASPVADKVEFSAAFARAKVAYPDIKLGYIGTDGTHHYFQKTGVPESYLVPVTEGWKAKG